MSNFAFLKVREHAWQALHEAAVRAEGAANFDPRVACLYARIGLERLVGWVYEHDPSVRTPYQGQLSALLHEPTFRNLVGSAVFNKTLVIKDLGNRAAHDAAPVPQQNALASVRELFHVCYWLAHTYTRKERPAPELAFKLELLPRPKATLPPRPAPTAPESSPQPPAQLKKLEEQLRESDERLRAALAQLAEKATVDEELQRLREEVAAARRANEEQPDTHDYSEAATRDLFIDLLLREAGWTLDQERDREFPVQGTPERPGRGFADYVLWGDDGKPLAVVEAKRTRRDARVGQEQARWYADCLELQFGQRPAIFYTNGYEHWLWDDQRHPPRPVQGFYSKDELELLIQRRSTRRPLSSATIQDGIVERYYQHRAIRRVCESFERDAHRKALLVMATGAGKTRTAIALVDLLQRCNWVRRVLFLADRLALVKQAVNAFKTHLPDASPVNLVEERDENGRVYVCTYPTMMGLIEEESDGRRRFGPGHFDLVIVDEAHRSVYQKYRAIFEHFDALLVGLTATPKDEIDRNTYSLFELERGVPTDAYSLDEAVKDGNLVPVQAVSVPLEFHRDGIRYADLSEDEKDRWDALEWSEDGLAPDRVDAGAINRWLFNADTVDKVLEHLMTRGQKVAGGDRLGKTIIFARNQAHAEFIAQRFDVSFPHHRGEFARVITCATERAQDLIDAFSRREKPPHIAISVDMLDTGVDIPEVVNLAFFKPVRSKTKFWQMVGRGTRLCKELFGPDEDKQFFFIFDYCQNLEFFSQALETSEGSLAESLGSRLFRARVDLIRTLDGRRRTSPGSSSDDGGDPQIHGHHVEPSLASGGAGNSPDPDTLRNETAESLRAQVVAMDIHNLLVRPQRRLVEKYSSPEAWASLGEAEQVELARHVAGLPSGNGDSDEEAKRFDLLILRLQLAMLRSDAGFERLRDQVRQIVGALEDKSAIPMVREQWALIQDMASDEWWQGLTVAGLESARKRLRGLVKFVDRARRKPVYTDFEDRMGPESTVLIDALQPGADFERFRAKARSFMRAHEDHVAIHHLRRNRALTPQDLEELERMLLEAGGTPEDITRARGECNGLGLFVRSLVGLDRETAKQAFSAFLTGTAITANQIEFINVIVDHLTEYGVMEAGRLYESPLIDISPHGPEGLFASKQVDELIAILDDIRSKAVA